VAEPYPFQEEGVTSLLKTLNRQKGVLLADEPGVGKSAQACLISNALAPASVCVVCPASLRVNWQREFAMWDIWGVKPALVTTKTSPVPQDIVINYDIIHRSEEVLNRRFDLLICDESHFAKNRTSKRSKALKVLADKADTVLLMTGTPVENRPVELFWQMVLMGWKSPSDYMEFAKRHCGYHRRQIFLKGGRRREIVDVSGATRLPELRQYLLDKGMVRRTKAEVMPELPPKSFQIVELPRRKQWRSSLLNDALPGEKVEKSQVAYFSSLAKIAAQTGDKRRLVDSLAEARRLDGEAKVEQALEFIKEQLEGGVEKIIVFAHHKAVFEALHVGLKQYGVVEICGSTGVLKRQNSVDQFQTNPKMRVFLGQIKAAGVGITLTAAHHVVFVELDWVPGLMGQAADRAHRNGQRNNVTVQYLVFEDSTDGIVARSLIQKQKTLNALLDGDYTDAPIDPFELF